MTEFDIENPTLHDAICELECLADRLEYQGISGGAYPGVHV